MPSRTTKRERAAVRRRLPAACRRWGTAYTARAARTLTDAVIRLALALDVPPHIIAGAELGASHWNATVEPGPFLFESWPQARRIRITGFGGSATFGADELPVSLAGPLGAGPELVVSASSGLHRHTDLSEPFRAPFLQPFIDEFARAAQPNRKSTHD